jgi:hypothetical protein
VAYFPLYFVSIRGDRARYASAAQPGVWTEFLR